MRESAKFQFPEIKSIFRGEAEVNRLASGEPDLTDSINSIL